MQHRKYTMTTPPDQATAAYIGAFVDELARAGVRHVCIAPGSRSTPLALTIAQHSRLRTWMHLDERSAAFFALGMARALGEPVALLCTSGTAAANFFPAVVEARSACVPLLLLTADRPPELRDIGATQTIDQNRLYGRYPKWFVEVTLAEATPGLLRYARTLACRAVAMAAAAPAGPVHLNFPFREPLVPTVAEPPANMSDSDALAWHGRPNGEPWVVVRDAPPAADAATVHAIAAQMTGARCPLIICGPQFDATLATPLAAFASALGAPLLVDPLSQLRWGTHDHCTLIDRYDALLHDDAMASSFVPDVVLRVGGLPTSKPLLQYMKRNGTARHIVVDAARWPDPALLAAEVIHADPRLLFEQLLSHVASQSNGTCRNADWLAGWRRANAQANTALADYLAGLDEPFEGAALAEIASLMPNGSTLFASSSMPVRDLDAFAAGDNRALRILANRGANGIDGVVSSALGAAATRAESDGPLVLVIGDVAFYHDMNGLLAARLHDIDATVVILNNDGGGIFSFLPQAAQPAHFEQLFGTPHGLRFEPVAKLYGAHYHQADSLQSLHAAVSAGISGRGLHIVEMRTDRARNVALHDEAWTRVASAVVAPAAAPAAARAAAHGEHTR
jgi:2-succinyl-5-enolpyruvyl-6-hydroxy-3-cyclohexene-1-carboxylate synthase